MDRYYRIIQSQRSRHSRISCIGEVLGSQRKHLALPKNLVGNLDSKIHWRWASCGQLDELVMSKLLIDGLTKEFIADSCRNNSGFEDLFRSIYTKNWTTPPNVLRLIIGYSICGLRPALCTSYLNKYRN